MTGLSTHGNGVTGCTAPNDFERQIGLMAVDSDEHAAVDFIVPDSQVWVIGIDFDFRIDLRIFGAIVRHRNQHGGLPRLHAFLERVVQVADGRGLLGRFLIPCPQD